MKEIGEGFLVSEGVTLSSKSKVQSQDWLLENPSIPEITNGGAIVLLLPTFLLCRNVPKSYYPMMNKKEIYQS